MENQKNKIKAFTTSRAFRTFVPFLLLSYLIWSLTNLASMQVDAVPVAVNYSNKPLAKKEAKVFPEKLEVMLETSGFNILKSKIFKEKITIDLDKEKFSSDTTAYITTASLINGLQDNFDTDTKVLSIKPDTLYYYYKKLISKKLPIKLNTNIKYATGYSNTKALLTKPDSIIVYGSASDLKNIKVINTVIFQKNDAKNTIKTNIALEKTKGLKYQKDSVLIEVIVDQYIIGTIDLPFRIKNSNAKKLITFPKTITLKYKVPLKVYKGLHESDFDIVCDYNKKENNVLKPKIIKKPKQLIIISEEPEEIQFLIKQ